MHFISIWLASALSFQLSEISNPIILTGAQRSPDRPSSDAHLNLVGAAKAAMSDLGEVGIAMHESTNDTNVASAWSSLESSESFLNSVKVQVSAAETANEGIAAEYERGSRTTLDVIQSNALLLSAQISLASSEKNYLMAQYNLLKAVGLLNSQYLKLK